MPCMGPTNYRSKEEAKFVAKELFPILTHLVTNKLSNFWIMSATEKALYKMFDELRSLDKSDISGYNYHSYDYTRLKYLTVGFLMAKLPTVTNERGGLSIDSTKFEFTEEDLARDLGDLFFNLDCEDF